MWIQLIEEARILQKLCIHVDIDDGLASELLKHLLEEGGLPLRVLIPVPLTRDRGYEVWNVKPLKRRNQSSGFLLVWSANRVVCYDHPGHIDSSPILHQSPNPGRNLTGSILRIQNRLMCQLAKEILCLPQLDSNDQVRYRHLFLLESSSETVVFLIGLKCQISPDCLTNIGRT